MAFWVILFSVSGIFDVFLRDPQYNEIAPTPNRHKVENIMALYVDNRRISFIKKWVNMCSHLCKKNSGGWGRMNISLFGGSWEIKTFAFWVKRHYEKNEKPIVVHGFFVIFYLFINSAACHGRVGGLRAQFDIKGTMKIKNKKKCYEPAILASAACQCRAS